MRARLTPHRPKADGDALVLFCWPREPLPAACPRPLAGQIAAWLARARFSARASETAVLPTWKSSGPANVLLVGLGDPRDFHPGVLRRAAGAAARAAVRQNWTSCSAELALPWKTAGLTPSEGVHLCGIGFIEGAYAFRTFMPRNGSSRTILLNIRSDALTQRAAQNALRSAQHAGDSINRARDLANLPGNHAPPRVIAKYARALARRSRLSCEVWGRARLVREKCGALLAVAQGSTAEPQLIILRYPGRKRGARPVVLVGKTITFDTGGISIKPARNMEWMKYDKSGGMAVLAAMELVGSVLRPDYPVVGILAAAENMPGGRATRPGDIVRSRSGKTIEIINTDAEGRLVLADALSVARDLDPSCVIDLATLTGAASVALGRFRSPLLGNHDRLADSLRLAGQRTGDRLWPLPLDQDYAAMLGSPFADLRNTGDGSAGTIAGAMFLRQFVPDNLPWAHIDLTSAWEERDSTTCAAGATLFGAALLADWIAAGGPAALAP